jgi:hypothetical protein
MAGACEHENEIFEFLTAVKMSMLVCWAVTPCGLVRRYQRIEGTYWKQCVGVYLQVYTALQPRRQTSLALQGFFFL